LSGGCGWITSSALEATSSSPIFAVVVEDLVFARREPDQLLKCVGDALVPLWGNIVDAGRYPGSLRKPSVRAGQDQ